MQEKPKDTKTKQKIMKYILLALNVALIILFLDTFGIHGVWMYLIFVSLITLPRLYMQRQQIIDFMKYVETVFFGKPLDKDMWEKGELKDGRKERRTINK